MTFSTITTIIGIAIIISALLYSLMYTASEADDLATELYEKKASETNVTELHDDTLYFAKTIETATEPSKRLEDGCYDLYVADRWKDIEILPHTNKLIDTGIATAFDPKWRLAIRERGSNTKSNMITMAGQVDSGYRGSIFVSIYNGNDVPIVITHNVEAVQKTDTKIFVPSSKAIAQFAMEEVPVLNVVETSYKALKDFKSERGNGALGSSGK